MTVVTSATSYASASDLMNHHDAGAIGDYAKDGAQLTPNQILTSTVVSASLLWASGLLESACVAGGRYTPTDLAALTGASAAYLKGIVCDLAFFKLACRRGRPDVSKTCPGYQDAMEALKALRMGETIFGFQEVMDASNMSTVDLSQNAQGLLTRTTDLARRRFGPRVDTALSSQPITGRP